MSKTPDFVKYAASIVPSERQIKWQETEFSALVYFGLNTFVGKQEGNGNIEAKDAVAIGFGFYESEDETKFDIGNIVMLKHIDMVQQGLLAEINSYGELDLEAPWWDQNIRPDLAINDMNFCLTGDIGTMYKRSIAVMIFNKVEKTFMDTV